MVFFSRTPRKKRHASLSYLALIIMHLAGQAGVAYADTLVLDFAPPQIEPTRICVPRPPDSETIATWENWDGIRLPEVSAAIVTRDINRLKQLDATLWLPKIEQMITRLEEAEPRFAGNNALIARISALESAGAFAELNSRQLVAELASQADSLSPRLKNALSRYLRDGIGITRDVAAANTLLIDAAFAGNADALLTLTKMELDGKGLAGWDVPADLAVTMAFGSLVGELDPSICDRASRIAREYHSGEIVTHDAQLAHDWFRFAADLGDSNSAWKIVEYHMRAEGFEKDNHLLLQYLRQAADAQLDYAQIELGRLYEAGSLVAQDLDEALNLFRAAAKSSERPGLTRLALFLEAHADRYPDLQEERYEALVALSELDDTAGWVFTRLAEETYVRKGRWAGRDEAMVYLERAAALGDLDGSIELALALLAERDDQRSFERAVNILSYSVSSLGGVTPTKLLHGAFMCSAPDSPRVQEASYWIAMEDATATRNVDISARDVLDLSPQSDPLILAQLQSHALYGRPKALAVYLKYLETNPAVKPEVQAFWNDYSNQYANVLDALARLELELAQNPQERAFAIDLLRQQYATVGGPAALPLAQALNNYSTAGTSNADEIREILQEPASLGIGAAIGLLVAHADEADAGRQIYTQYAEVIARDGDFDALVFAIPFVEGEVRAAYLSRAAGIIPCDYKHAMIMTDLLLSIDDTDGALRWMEIAGHLTDGNSWALTDLGRSQLEVLGDDAASDALALFERAVNMGDMNAHSDMFELLVKPDTTVYDPIRASQVISETAALGDSTILARLLGRYRNADPAAKLVIDAQLDMPNIYFTAARSGDIYSMRAYAIYQRETAKTEADLISSTEWFTRAAEGGDVTAMAELGYALAFGIGTEPNLNTAIVWLEKAAAAGSKKAMEITSLIKFDKDT